MHYDLHRMSVLATCLQSVAEKEAGPIGNTLQAHNLIRLAVQLLQPETQYQ
jgi:hypothetical protein